MCPSSYSDYRKFMLKIVIPQNFGMIRKNSKGEYKVVSFSKRAIFHSKVKGFLIGGYQMNHFGE